MQDINEQINKKILPLEKLSGVVKKLKDQGKVIVHCHGVFDLLTPAHTHQFIQARKKGDVVIVTVTEDKHVNKGPGRPYFNQEIRLKQVASQIAVDYVALNKSLNAVEAINYIKPDYFVKGESNRNHKYLKDSGFAVELKAIKKNGGDIFFTEELPFHSSEILNKFLPVFPPETKKWLDQFKKNHSAQNVISKMRELRKVKCLLIGETIVDEYCYVKALGKPTKGSHLAVDITGKEIHAGGILAAANHLAGFCDNVDVITCVGSDGGEKLIKDRIRPNVKVNFFKKDGVTISKKRFVEPAYMSKLFQVYEGNLAPLTPNEETKLIQVLKKVFKKGKYDVVLVIDYGHGFINQRTADFISKNAPWLSLSVQTNTANFGYNMVTKYKKADYVCIDEPEFRLSLHNQWDDLSFLVKKMLSTHQYKKLLVTRGHHGCFVPNVKNNSHLQIPVFSTKIVDTVGAGDAFIAMSSPCMKLGMPMEIVGFIGNAAGALAVGTVGNRSPIEPMTLYNFINTLLK